MTEFRKLGPCGECVHWRGATMEILAGTSAQTGRCYRSVSPDEGNFLRPHQPTTRVDMECGEHLPLPVPDHLPGNCGGCRFWKDPAKSYPQDHDEGYCLVRPPRWNEKREYNGDQIGSYLHAVPKTPRFFICGDAVARDFVEPSAASRTRAKAKV